MALGEDQTWPEDGWPLRAADRDHIQPGTAGSGERAVSIALTRIIDRVHSAVSTERAITVAEVEAAVELASRGHHSEITDSDAARRVAASAQDLFDGPGPLNFDILALLAILVAKRTNPAEWTSATWRATDHQVLERVRGEIVSDRSARIDAPRARLRLIGTAVDRAWNAARDENYWDLLAAQNVAERAASVDRLDDPRPADAPTVIVVSARREHLDPEQLATVLRRAEPLVQEAQKALDEDRFDPATALTLSAWVRTFRMHANETPDPSPRVLELAGAAIAAILAPAPEVIDGAVSKAAAAGVVDEDQAAAIGGDVKAAIGASAELGGDDEGVSVESANRMAAAVSDLDERTDGIVVDDRPLAGVDTARKVAVVFAKAGVAVALTSLVAALISWASGAISFFH